MVCTLYEHSTDGLTPSKVIRVLCHFPTVCWRQVLEQICLSPAVKIGMEKRERMIHEQRDSIRAYVADLFVVEVIRLSFTKSYLDRHYFWCCPMQQRN